jgi:penicillin-insensitive murein endopeptidase
VPSGRFYGTWQLTQLLERAARRVAFRLPGVRLSLGELSGKEGGDIGGHNSHESGRDADVGFFTRLADGRPYSGTAFAEFDAAGRGLAPNGGLRFDDARNWELVSKLVDDNEARVQYIFVSRGIRQRLLREALRSKAPAEVISRAQAVLVEPAHGNPHRSHFHVRIYCPPADRPLCLDVGPFWTWYPANPQLEHGPALAAQRPGLALGGPLQLAGD